MRAFTCLGLTVSLLSSTTIASAQESSGQSVHRCVGVRGEIVFSGVPCSESGATDVGIRAAAAPAADTSPALPVTCPVSREELRDRIAAAVGRRDANALAGLLRWGGVGGGAANARLRELRDLTRQPLLAIDAGDGTDADHDGESLRVRTGSNETGGVREHTFGLSAQTGCLWLTW